MRSSRADAACVDLSIVIRWAPMRFTIRQMMILIVFVSIPLAALAYALRLSGSWRMLFLQFAGSLVPCILLGLTALIVRPGPGRNILGRVFYCGFFISIALLPVFVVADAWGRSLGISLLLMFLVSINAIILFGLISDTMPSICPSCCRRRLCPSGAVNFGSIPTEGRFRGRWHQFRWCCHCGAKLKKRRLGLFRYGPWEDASSLAESKHFWLWTPRLRSREITDESPSRNLADPRNDPAIERVE
jgi:hypothetical protein